MNCSHPFAPHLRPLQVLAIAIIVAQFAGPAHATNFQGGYKTNTSITLSNESSPPSPSGYLVIDLGTDRQPLAVNNRGTVLLQRPNTTFNAFYRWKAVKPYQGAEQLLVGTTVWPRSVARGVNNNDEVWGYVAPTAGFLPQVTYWPSVNTTPLAWFGPNSVPADWDYQSTEPYFFGDNRRFWIDRTLGKNSTTRSSVFTSSVPGEPDELFTDFTQPPYGQGDDMVVNSVSQSGDMIGVFFRRDGSLAYQFAGRHPRRGFSPAVSIAAGAKINARGLALLPEYVAATAGTIGPLYLWDLAHPDAYRAIGIARSPVPLPGRAPPYIGLSTPKDERDPLVIVNDREVLIEQVNDGAPELTLQRYPAQSLLPAGSPWQNFRAVTVSDNAYFIAGVADDASGSRHTLLRARVDGIGLAVDANRDGDIHLASEVVDASKSDATSAASPYRFWVNDDIDRGHVVDDTDWEEDDLGGAEASGKEPDWKDNVANSRRDLEDFARLQIHLTGLAEAVKNGDLYLGVKWTDVTGSPAIKLYKQYDAAGDTSYLTDEFKASLQEPEPAILNDRYASEAPTTSVHTLVEPGELFVLPQGVWLGLTGDALKRTLLFEGCKPGKGQLKLVILKRDGANYTEIGEDPGVWLDLKKIGDMYEHWTLGNGNGTEPEPIAARVASENGSSSAFGYSASSPEEQKYILFVHGWNIEKWEKERFAETAYKRLYWQGYKGRFGLFSWPCTNGFASEMDAILDSTNYDRGEFSGWRSASPLRQVMQMLNSAYGGELYVLSHSMGGVVTSEALRLQSDARGSQIAKVYVASQAALPAHTYDGTLSAATGSPNALQWDYDHPQIPSGIQNYGPHTPNIYKNWMAFVLGGSGVSSSSVGTLVNFYNENDWALAAPVWQFNQITKPDYTDLPAQPYQYDYSGDIETLPFDGFRKFLFTVADATSLTVGNRTTLGDRYEIMSFAAESRVKALGATPNVSQGITRAVNLRTLWPADPDDHSAHKWHSAQFRSTIQKQRNYWKTLLSDQVFDVPTITLP